MPASNRVRKGILAAAFLVAAAGSVRADMDPTAGRWEPYTDFYTRQALIWSNQAYTIANNSQNGLLAYQYSYAAQYYAGYTWRTMYLNYVAGSTDFATYYNWLVLSHQYAYYASAYTYVANAESPNNFGQTAANYAYYAYRTAYGALSLPPPTQDLPPNTDRRQMRFLVYRINVARTGLNLTPLVRDSRLDAACTDYINYAFAGGVQQWQQIIATFAQQRGYTPRTDPIPLAYLDTGADELTVFSKHPDTLNVTNKSVQGTGINYVIKDIGVSAAYNANQKAIYWLVYVTAP